LQQNFNSTHDEIKKTFFCQVWNLKFPALLLCHWKEKVRHMDNQQRCFKKRTFKSNKNTDFKRWMKFLWNSSHIFVQLLSFCIYCCSLKTDHNFCWQNTKHYESTIRRYQGVVPLRFILRFNCILRLQSNNIWHKYAYMSRYLFVTRCAKFILIFYLSFICLHLLTIKVWFIFLQQKLIAFCYSRNKDHTLLNVVQKYEIIKNICRI